MTIDWGNTNIITVEISDLTLDSGTSYNYDANSFHIDMKRLEDDENGMPFPDTHTHVAPIVLGGLTLARVVEVVSPYTVMFEDGMYGVTILNGNTNIADVIVRNQVSVNTQNAAGLVAINEIQYMIHGTVGNADVNEDDNEVTIRDADLNVIRQLSVSEDARVRRIL